MTRLPQAAESSDAFSDSFAVNRSVIVAGNWKLNPPREEGWRLFQEVCAGVARRGEIPSSLQVVIFPPLPYLGAWAAEWKPENGAAIELGAQDVAQETWGAFTGQVGAPLLKEFGARYVLVGHSERRHLFGESDVITGSKVSAAITAGLIPVLCVGETEP
ncbi:MAG: triose-phosphate isomerase family protein, partial [Planctomycetota bacterium]